jgi:hypothetical protein
VYHIAFADFSKEANTMSHRELVRLRDRYPTVSRMTIWRMRQEPGFPDGVVINGTEYHYSDELDAFEEARRRLTLRSTTAASNPAT